VARPRDLGDAIMACQPVVRGSVPNEWWMLHELPTYISLDIVLVDTYAELMNLNSNEIEFKFQTNLNIIIMY
jgi:hypothetical protein